MRWRSAWTVAVDAPKGRKVFRVGPAWAAAEMTLKGEVHPERDTAF